LTALEPLRRKFTGVVVGLKSPQILIILSIFGISFLVLFFTPSSTYSNAASTYNLSINSSFGTTYGTGTYSNGSEATFGVSPTIVYVAGGSTRYLFEGWSCSGAGCYSGSNSSSSVIMNNDIIETALWITQYLLSSSTTGNGSVNPSGQNWYDAGSIVHVYETPAVGQWVFAYWGLDGQNVGSSQTYTVTMNSPHVLVANYVEVEIQSKLVNVTDSFGNNMRNPDGTFYRLDKFEVKYRVVTSGGNGTLPSSVTFDVNVTYPHNVLGEVAYGKDYDIFIILPNAPPDSYNITLSAFTVNSSNSSKTSIPIYGYEPFSVVNYSPHFTYFTYMDYNALNSSTYERPFFVLLRYDGNSPGYGYSGDINTDPFNAINSTGERAMLNNFTFSTNGWSISSNAGVPNVSMSIMNFIEHQHDSLSVALLNNSKTGGFPNVITWSNRVQKYFFLASIQQLKNYISVDSIMYFNVTVSAWYVNTYNSNMYRSSDFNTSYLYEPIFYNGYLIFKPSSGSSADFSVSIVAHNPSPLDTYLVSETISIFGNDNSVISSLEQDLYPAYSSTVLKPVISNSQEWVFLINQTNIATPNVDGMPYFTVSVSGNNGYTEYFYQPNNSPYYLSSPVTYRGQGTLNTTYDVYDYFGLFAMSDFPSSFPFTELTGYYMMQPSVGEDLVMQPLNFSFSSSSMPYLVRTYADSSGPFFISFEPGNLTQSYAMVYGDNSTTFVSPNFVGGGIIGLDGNPVSLNGGTSYEVSLLIGYQSGGAFYVWVMSDRGQVLCNESLLTSSSSSLTGLFGPSGYVGEYTFQFPVGNTNSSVSIYIENSWGALSVIRGVEITPHSPPALSYSPGSLAAILVLAFAISSGYAVFGKKRRRSNS
jgi:hypothetical protein